MFGIAFAFAPIACLSLYPQGNTLMKSYSRLSLTVVALVLASIPAAALADDADPPPEKISKYMRAKLVHSQKILEALALEDFEQMAKHSQDLKLLSQESIWNVLQTEQYVLHSDDFRRRTNALTDAAKKKNLDAASLAYVELTLNCVQCHKYVRDVRRGAVEPPVEAPKPTPKSGKK